MYRSLALGSLLGRTTGASATARLQCHAPAMAIATPTQHPHHYPVAFYSDGARPGFFKNIINNMKEEFTKDKGMQENLKKFREEAKKLEESEALQEARRKFQTIEESAKKQSTSSAFKEHLSGLQEKVKGTLEDNEQLKKASQLGSDLGKKAEGAAKVVGDAAESIGKSGVFKTATEGAQTLKQEIEGQALGGRVYRAPVTLRKRKEYVAAEGEEAPIAPNEEAVGVELHKDSRFHASWESFKQDSAFAKTFFQARHKLEESDNGFVRGARVVSDKMQDLFGGLFTRTELSETLTQITAVDPSFDRDNFLRSCETDIIPTILEAMIRGDSEILKDWCFEAPYNILNAPITTAQQLGYVFDSKVLDIDNVDLAMGKMMEQGPVLVITFTSQQILCVRDLKGKVVEGDPEKVLRVTYVWVLCRDQTELDPRAAWRLLELSASSAEQML